MLLSHFYFHVMLMEYRFLALFQYIGSWYLTLCSSIAKQWSYFTDADFKVVGSRESKDACIGR